KALYRAADILILDEPTAVLTPQEARELFEILKTLTNEGMSVIFITHKLNEVLEVADRITVLRRGKRIDTVDRQGATEQGLARMMVGRDVLLRVDKAAPEVAESLLSVDDLHVVDDRGLEAVRLALGLVVSSAADSPSARSVEAVRRPGRWPADSGSGALRRQSAEGRARA